MSGAPLERLLELMKEDRLRKSTMGDRGILIASESDKGRVINSSAFRRLQQKAQVFPLDLNAAVRTRLTHSIEVSQVGRHLAQKVIQGFARHHNGPYDKLAAFVNTVETACLLHDLGNPPFGHFGEAAICEWFEENNYSLENALNFDGNPQGFRIMSFLSGADEYGFNLTCTLLLSTVKYPWSWYDKPSPQKKIGLFSSDTPAYEQACKNVGWITGKRFPFLLLMDTADDIAFSTRDLEDGLEKKIIGLDDLIKEFGNARFAAKSVEPIVGFKTSVINQAADVASSNFVKRIDEILQGEDVELIDKNSEIGDLLEKVNAFARERVYSDEAAEYVELAGRSVIKGLLNHFKPLLTLDEAKFRLAVEGKANKDLPLEARLARRLPASYCRKYLVSGRGSEPEKRAHLITDFVAGMTDDFALHMYQVLEGIKTQ